MKTFTVVGWTWGAEAWCTGCAKSHHEYDQMKDPNVDGGPIFAATESDHKLRCPGCKGIINNQVIQPEELYS